MFMVVGTRTFNITLSVFQGIMNRGRFWFNQHGVIVVRYDYVTDQVTWIELKMPRFAFKFML